MPSGELNARHPTAATESIGVDFGVARPELTHTLAQLPRDTSQVVIGSILDRLAGWSSCHCELLVLGWVFLLVLFAENKVPEAVSVYK